MYEVCYKHVLQTNVGHFFFLHSIAHLREGLGFEVPRLRDKIVGDRSIL